MIEESKYGLLASDIDDIVSLLKQNKKSIK